MIGILSSPIPPRPTTSVSSCYSAATMGRRQSPLPLLHIVGCSNGWHSRFRCLSCGRNPASSSSGDNKSKVVLDAFFLGKAFAEALNERVGSAVGEVIGIFGQWQAEQQKQVQDFQDEVIVRAKKAKEKAAVEAMKVQGIIAEPLAGPPTTHAVVTPSNGGPASEYPLNGILND